MLTGRGERMRASGPVECEVGRADALGGVSRDVPPVFFWQLDKQAVRDL
jgi:hypothetical protein